MIAAVDTYLAVRRLGGFALSNNEYLLRSFAAYAGAHGEAVVRTATVITWASLGPSLAQRHRRYETVRQCAAQLHLDDPRHDVPPARYFGYRKTRRPPRLYTETEIDQLLTVAARLRPVDALTPHTYVALLSLLAATGLRISEALALAGHTQRRAGRSQGYPHTATRAALDPHSAVGRRRRWCNPQQSHPPHSPGGYASRFSSRAFQTHPRVADGILDPSSYSSS
jgi:integrase